MDEQDGVDIVFLDINKAFDAILYNIFLDKLSSWTGAQCVVKCRMKDLLKAEFKSLLCMELHLAADQSPEVFLKVQS